MDEDEETYADEINFIRPRRQQRRRRPFIMKRRGPNYQNQQYVQRGRYQNKGGYINKTEHYDEDEEDLSDFSDIEYDTPNSVNQAIDDDAFIMEDEAIYRINTPNGKGFIIPDSLGVERNECFKCGSKNHFFKGKSSFRCPYKDQPLASKCTNCGKGGHKPELCQGKRDTENNVKNVNRTIPQEFDPKNM